MGDIVKVATEYVIKNMDDMKKFVQEIGRTYSSEKQRVRKLFEAQNFDVSGFGEFLMPPDGMPYGRKLLYRDSEMEVILMNWATNTACLPHDHGASEGWVKVLKGTASHGYYSKKSKIPVLTKEEELDEGTVLYAPKNLVHHMANKTSNVLITLHIYFPSISNMEVFDVESHRAAIVSDDCGAWWPESEEQLIEYRALR